jgi:hypothetical protein
MRIGLYSVTYRGVWYRGGAVDVSVSYVLRKSKDGRDWNWTRNARTRLRWTCLSMTERGFATWQELSLGGPRVKRYTRTNQWRRYIT